MKTNRLFVPMPMPALSLCFCFLIVLFSCKTEPKKETADETEEDTGTQIDILTEVMDFQTVDSIPAGWHTFRYQNLSEETHFFLLDKYPTGKAIADGEKEVIGPFQKGMDLINEGKGEEANAEFGKLPEWFFEVVFSGGSGLVSPGHTSQTTLKLEPGYYVMECYVKMPNGVFHSAMGMVKELIVTGDMSENRAPESTVNISISSTDGIVHPDTIRGGPQTFAVQYLDQIVHENFVGHDVNLVRFDEGAESQTLEKWMNWADPEGLITPAPEGFTFLGGVNDMPEGSTGYFTATLSPGTYALVAEVPETIRKNMLKTFIVGD